MTDRLVSMTGFGRASGTLADGASYVWEIRSVNGRNLDLRLRLPPGMEALEGRLREAVQARCKRGNISATLTLKREERAPRLAVDTAVLDQFLALALEVAARIPGAAPPRAEALLTLPGVLKGAENAADEASEAARQAALAAGFAEALDGLDAARRAEGRKLGLILATLLDEIAALCRAAVAEAASQPAAQKQRLLDQLAALLEGERRISEERLAAEAALLASKSDVREELDRLAAHLEQARALLAAGEAAGRKLDFLTQEFVREANTLCAKSATVALTRTGLSLKAAIERLKEQAANVE